MFYFLWILNALSIVYVLASAGMDLRERMIYTFPCDALVTLGGMYLFISHVYPMWFVACNLCLDLSVCLIFKWRKIWGAGDSNLLLLFFVVYMMNSSHGAGVMFFVAEMMMFAIALAFAIVFGYLEVKKKHKKLNKNCSIAVAPGFAVAIIVIIFSGVMIC